MPLQVPCLIIGAGADDGGVCVLMHACALACVRCAWARAIERACVRACKLKQPVSSNYHAELYYN